MEVAQADIDLEASAGKYYWGEDKKLYIIVAKGDYADIAAARTGLDVTSLNYQLAEPVVTPIQVIGNLVSYPSGTVYFDPVVADVDFYGEGVVVDGVTFSSIDKVTKIDFETGTEEDVTDTCTLNANNNGFTSTALSANDLCWFELAIDPSTTTQGEKSFGYYDSRYVVIDDVTGTAYRYKASVSDGVLTWTLEAVE